jgi:ubiquinone/menaquinone biosynthesis C-methylase UbiE
MSETKYGQSLFATTAAYYEKYRPRYPQELFMKIIEVFEPSDDDVLLDLGCGTGEIALPLAKHFKQVLAWDPDGEMLEIAKQKAKEQGVTNVMFEQKSSNDLSTLDEPIKLVTMGQSFHWMDGGGTLDEIKRHLADRGGVALVSVQHGLHIYSTSFDEPNILTAQRNEIVRKIGLKYLGEKRKAGKRTFKKDEQSWIDMLVGSGFANVHEFVFDKTLKRSIDDTVGFLLSTSWGNTRQLGGQVAHFERELQDKLLEMAPSGVFDEKVVFSLLCGTKTENQTAL